VRVRVGARGCSLQQGSTRSATRAEKRDLGWGCARKSNAQQQGQAARPRPRPAPSADEGRRTRRHSKRNCTHSYSVSTGKGDYSRAARGPARGGKKRDHAGGRHSSTCATQGPKERDTGKPPHQAVGLATAPSKATGQRRTVGASPHAMVAMDQNRRAAGAYVLPVSVGENTDNRTATKKETQPATECCPQRGSPPLPLRPSASLTDPPRPPTPRTRAECATVSRPAAPSAPPPP